MREWTRHNISKFWPFVLVHSRGQLPINGSISLLVNVQICRRTVLARLFQYCSNVQTGKDYSPNQAQLQLNFTFHFVRMWGSKLFLHAVEHKLVEPGNRGPRRWKDREEIRRAKDGREEKSEREGYFFSLSLPLLSLGFIFLSVWVCWVLVLFLRKPANLSICVSLAPQ